MTAAPIRCARRGAFEPIIASGGIVVAGPSCLPLGDPASNRARGPIGAIGVAVAMPAALAFPAAVTFPAAVAAPAGRVAFRPFIPRHPLVMIDADAGGVAFGVLRDGFVVRAVPVPAPSHDVGRAIRWPSRLWRPGCGVPARRNRAPHAQSGRAHRDGGPSRVRWRHAAGRQPRHHPRARRP